MPKRRLYEEEGDEEEVVHTPNVPKLLFPTSFTRVGAQTVADPTLLPAPWTICGEALITASCDLCVYFFFKFAKRYLNRPQFSYLIFYLFQPTTGDGGSHQRLVSPHFASLRTDLAGVAAIPRIPAARNNNYCGAPQQAWLGRNMLVSRVRAFLHKLAPCVPFHQRGSKEMKSR